LRSLLGETVSCSEIVVDGRWGFVGSANVDVRSFAFNFEVGALVEDPGFAAKLEENFLEDLARSEEITAETVARYGSWKRLKHAAARLLSPIL
jgi:cardiolipin synthase